MGRLSVDALAWLGSFVCLEFILWSFNRVLLSTDGLWRSPVVMFFAGVLFAVAAITVAIVCFFIFLTERYRPKDDGEDERASSWAQQRALRRGGASPHRSWLLRRGRGARGDAAAPQLVTTHPGAVRQGAFSGPVWLVPATLWARSQQAAQWPPPTQGPAAIARRYHATLVGAGSESGAALVLVPEPVQGRAGGGSRRAQVHPVGTGDEPASSLLSLQGVELDLLRDVLGTRSPWSRRYPLQLSHPSRPLLLGETTVYLFAESGSAKEQWYAALTVAVAPNSLLSATHQLYDNYCRYMASLQLEPPPPMPPAPPQPPMAPPQPPGVRQPAQQQKADPAKKASATAAAAKPPSKPASEAAKEQGGREKQPPRSDPSQPQPQLAGQPDSTAPAGTVAPRRGGRNPFGFLLSRFGRGAGRRHDAPPAAATTTAAAAALLSGPVGASPSRSASVPDLHPGGGGGSDGSARQPAQESLPRPQLQAPEPEGQQGPPPRPPPQQLQQSADTGQGGGLDPDRDSARVAAGEARKREPPESQEQEPRQPERQLQGHEQEQEPEETAGGQTEQPSQPHHSRRKGHAPPLELPSGVDAGAAVAAADAKSAAMAAAKSGPLPVCRVVSDIFAASMPFSSSTGHDQPQELLPADAAATADAVPTDAGPGGSASVAGALPQVVRPRSVGGDVPASTGARKKADAGEVPAPSERLACAPQEGLDGRSCDAAPPLEPQAANVAAARSQAGGRPAAAAACAPSSRSGPAEPSFNSWSMPELASPVGRGATGRLSAPGPATATAIFPGEGADLGVPGPAVTHTARQQPGTAAAVSGGVVAGDVKLGAEAKRAAGPSGPSSAGPDGEPIPALLESPASPQQPTRGSAFGMNSLSPVTSISALETLDSASLTAAAMLSFSEASPVLAAGRAIGLPQLPAATPATCPQHRPGTSPLSQQSRHRHGGSMPDLFEVARRMAEEQAAGPAAAAAATTGARSGMGTAIHPARRSLDDVMSAAAAACPTSHQQHYQHKQEHARSQPHGLGSRAEELPGFGAGSAAGATASAPDVPRNLSKQDLRRLQREEQERVKQEQQRAKVAARAAEEARKADERAARERAKVEAQQRRRQVEEARTRQANERSRGPKQQQQRLTSAKYLQDPTAATAASAAAAPPQLQPPPTGASGTTPRSASGSAVAPVGYDAAAAADAASAAGTDTARAPLNPAPGAAADPVAKPLTGGDGAGAGPKPAEPAVPPPPPPPSAPPCGALVEVLYGLNMVLVRLGFELLRRRGFSAWLQRLIQIRLDCLRRPRFLDPLALTRFDLGCTAPQLRNMRAVAGPNNFGPGSPIWPQLALDVVWEGTATATISTKIDFDRAAPDRAAARSTGSASGPTPPSTGARGTAGEAATQRPEVSAAAAFASSAAKVGSQTAGPLPAASAAKPEGLCAKCSGADVATSAAAAAAAAGPSGEITSKGEHGEAESPSPALPADKGSDAVAAQGGAAAVGAAGGAPSQAAAAASSTPPERASGGGNPAAAGGAAAARTAGPAAAKDGGAGGGLGGRGGGFWTSFFPIFSVVRRAGKALASNLAGSLSGTPVQLHLTARRFEGTLLLWLAPPPSDRLWLSFAAPPKLQFSVAPVAAGFSSGLVGGRLSAWARGKVTDGLTRAMVYPACVDVWMGKLLLSVDSPEEAVRRFKPPQPPTRARSPPPPPTPVPVASAPPPPVQAQQQASMQQPQPLQQHTSAPGTEARSGEAALLHVPSAPTLGAASRPAGRPPRPPTFSASPGNLSPWGHWPGESGLAAGAAPQQPQMTIAPLPAFEGGGGLTGATGGGGSSAFSAPSYAAAAAAPSNNTVAPYGGSGLLEIALTRVVRGSSSLWGSSPGTTSPLDGLSDGLSDAGHASQEEEGEEGEEYEGEDEEGLGDEEEDEDESYTERGGVGEDSGRCHRRRGTDGGSEYGMHRQGTDFGDGGDAAAAATQGWRPSYGSGSGDASGGQWFSPHVSVDGSWAGWPLPAASTQPGAEGAMLHMQTRDSFASASSSSLGAQWQPQQQQQQQLQQQTQGGRRRGPLHWVGGAAGLVARGVGGVGGAGIRGLSAVGSALGQAMLGPVVHAGERAVVQQQLRAAKVANMPERPAMESRQLTAADG